MRLVAWLTGCQFRCVYCHNPDTWKMTNGMPVPLTRAVEVVKQYRHEPADHEGRPDHQRRRAADATSLRAQAVSAAKQMGVHTALDTNGYLGDRLSDEDLASIDLVLLGLKAIAPDLHQRLTGMDNQPVHEFARRLAARKHRSGFASSSCPAGPTTWTRSGAWPISRRAWATSNGWTCCHSIRWAASSGRSSGWNYQMRDVEPPSQEKVDEAIARFQAAGLNIV